ncbi:cytochrome b5 family heme/steroid binding domain-containing protein [Besnoitia besnoiti]|uniref:Cytochrome b5 family heme/steroid binding domain-containing protein n=1 Tax=Besnoitia besnoiti TaxID=94643 RepID=A0A2A9M7A8_BESBE|nr:cytochrome b5 family heme/steroid binding domain-containing protein [Besnoitia besnoiti]PFH31290.1 cytochrome b5 family heme/steroid binding domain-containing protein [Besnoitia besnoiti]
MKEWLQKLDFWTVAGVAVGSFAAYKMLSASLGYFSSSASSARLGGSSGGRQTCNEGEDEYYRAPPKPKPCPRDFTLEELRPFDGTQTAPAGLEAPAAAPGEGDAGVHPPEDLDPASASAVAAAAVGALPPIYIALKGRVYDVTSHPDGRHFYSADGPYGIFAGKDVTVNLAKMVFDESENNQGPSAWATLSALEKQTVDDWEDRFRAKYAPVGYVVFGHPEEDAKIREIYAEEREKAGLPL